MRWSTERELNETVAWDFSELSMCVLYGMKENSLRFLGETRHVDGKLRANGGVFLPYKPCVVTGHHWDLAVRWLGGL